MTKPQKRVTIQSMKDVIPIYEEHPTVPFNTFLTDALDTTCHGHKFIEVFYVVNGSIEHHINGVKEAITVGDLYLIFPNTPHYFIRKNDCTHRDFVVNLSLAEPAFEYINRDFFKNLERNKFVRCKITTEDILFLEQNIKNYFEELDISKRKNFERVLVSTIFGLIYLYANKNTRIENFRAQCEEAVSNAFIQKNALDIIRNELGYNKYYLCRKFKETFGCTLLDYVNALKLNHATYLLKTTHYTIAEICEQIGIESMPYFIKIFTKKYGVTPAKYRKQGLKD